jgi:alpha-tubulin suppressor-like RCC1 family protein
MSIRNNNLGSIVKPGFNALGAQTSVTTYTYELWSWGNGDYGALGLGNLTSYSSPKQIGALTTWLSISAGNSGGAALKTNGTLWVWGYNNTGQIGDGTTTNRSSPVQIGALTTWAVVSFGAALTAAIKTDGTLWTWGYNSAGQLGLGDSGAYTDRSSPNQVGALTTWSKVTAGDSFVIAIKTDGTLWSWGYNNYGQLANGFISSRSSPVQVGALTTWSSISVGGAYATAAAIKTNGTLWVWGLNDYGQLGLGDVTNRSSPVQVGALTTWSKVSAGGPFHTIAIKTDGTLWSWGRNQYGQLGLSNITNYSSPKQVGALTTWLSIAIWNSSGSAIKTDGTLWSWGFNTYGQLGLGNTTNYSSPKQVGALTTWYSVMVGDGPTIALKY